MLGSRYHRSFVLQDASNQMTRDGECILLFAWLSYKPLGALGGD